MVRAYLMSYTLQQYFLRSSAFSSKFPHAWLVWEPGHWTSPPYDESTVVPKPGRDAQVDVAAAMASGNALCFELKPPLPPRPIKVGRAPSNDLVINDGTVSREHLGLRFDEAGAKWIASLLPQAKATTLRGMAFPPGEATLRDGDLVKLGDIQLTFHDPPGFVKRLETEVRKQLDKPPARSLG
jgi:hypothetical protein